MFLPVGKKQVFAVGGGQLEGQFFLVSRKGDVSVFGNHIAVKRKLVQMVFIVADKKAIEGQRLIREVVKLKIIRRGVLDGVMAAIVGAYFIDAEG